MSLFLIETRPDRTGQRCSCIVAAESISSACIKAEEVLGYARPEYVFLLPDERQAASARALSELAQWRVSHFTSFGKSRYDIR
jgi:hypothetical protein